MEPARGAGAPASPPSSSRPADPDAISSTTAGLPPVLADCAGGPDSQCAANSSAGAAYLPANVVGGTYGFRVFLVGGGGGGGSHDDGVGQPAGQRRPGPLRQGGHQRDRH